MSNEWADLMEFVETPEAKKVDEEVRAEALTAAMVLEEVARWGTGVDEATMAEFVRIISLRPGQDGVRLFKVLREALPNDGLREIVDQEWARLRPDGTSTGAEVRYDFDDEFDLVNAINDKCAVIRREGTWEFVFWKEDGAPVFSKKRDAEIALAQYRFHYAMKKKPKELPGFAVWLKSARRREFKGVGFYPDESKCPNGYLNLWTGFAVRPAPGDWSLMRDHIRDNVCSGDAVQFEYMLDWFSQLFCEPGRKSEVIIAIRGLQGVGKSKLPEWICEIIGPRHSMVIEKGKHITGHFNAHLETKIFVLCEEAFFAGDPVAGKALKHLGTGKNYTYESKGVDPREGLNFTRVIMPTNEGWVAPVEAGDRRYFVTDCSAKQKENKEYFAAIDKQMENGGAAAMLHDLLERGMTFAKLGKPPMTDAKNDQIRQSMPQAMKWLASVLSDGMFLFKEEGTMVGVEWPLDGGLVLKSSMLSSYRESVPGFRAPPTAEEFGLFLKKHIPDLKSKKVSDFPGSHKRVPHYDLPSLELARAEFIRVNPGYVFDTVETEADDTAKLAANDHKPDLKEAG